MKRAIPKVDPDLLPYAEPRRKLPPRKYTYTKTLAPRELQVIQLKALGMTNVGIAIKLDIGEQTVKNHVSNSYRKYEVTSLPELFIAMGWLRIPGIHQGIWIDDKPLQLRPSIIQRRPII